MNSQVSPQGSVNFERLRSHQNSPQKLRIGLNTTSLSRRLSSTFGTLRRFPGPSTRIALLAHELHNIAPIHGTALRTRLGITSGAQRYLVVNIPDRERDFVWGPRTASR